MSGTERIANQLWIHARASTRQSQKGRTSRAYRQWRVSAWERICYLVSVQQTNPQGGSLIFQGALKNVRKTREDVLLMAATRKWSLYYLKTLRDVMKTISMHHFSLLRNRPLSKLPSPKELTSCSAKRCTNLRILNTLCKVSAVTSTRHPQSQ